MVGQQWWGSSGGRAVVGEQWWESSGSRAVVREQRWGSMGGEATVGEQKRSGAARRRDRINQFRAHRVASTGVRTN